MPPIYTTQATQPNRTSLLIGHPAHIYLRKPGKGQQGFSVWYRPVTRTSARAVTLRYLLLELFMKYAYDPCKTLVLVDRLIANYGLLLTSHSLPPSVTLTSPTAAVPYQSLNKVGDVTVEFLMVGFEFLSLREVAWPRGADRVSRVLHTFAVRDNIQVLKNAG